MNVERPSHGSINEAGIRTVDAKSQEPRSIDSMSCIRDAVLTPRMVEGLIADGHSIVIYEDFILRLDTWLDRHPGGQLAILHMVGRDATDEMRA